MKVLGIDTILHSTCISLVENGRKVLSSITEKHVFKSDDLYNLTLAHLRSIRKTFEKAIIKAKLKDIKEIKLIAVNNFGSQASNVLIGMSLAEFLAKDIKVPLIGVSHKDAHLFSCWLGCNPKKFNFPIIVLSSSGGHSVISLIKKNNFKSETIVEMEGMNKKGKNLPNFRGIGAVYGFVAYALGIGEQIGGASALAQIAKRGNPFKFNLFFNRPGNASILDFSFLERKIASFLKKKKKKGKFNELFIADFAASFEHAISEILLKDLINVAQKYKAKEIHLVGGISANFLLRKKIPIFARKAGMIGRFPTKLEYCTDNAAMTASLGYYRYKNNPRSLEKKVKLISNFRLEKIAIDQILETKSKNNLYYL